MHCPDSSDLLALLDGALSEIRALEVGQHLEMCSPCQHRLNQLSDDTELQHWRGAGRIHVSRPAVHATCQAMIDRLANRDTSVESHSITPASDDAIRIESLLRGFEASSFDGDIGLLGHYRIRRQIGQGGMAVVFEAIDMQLDRVVAIKVLRPELIASFSHERFIREAKALAGVKHPNVVSVYGVSVSKSGFPFIAMELVDGGSLRDQIDEQTTLDFRKAAKWIAEAGSGLFAVHSQGLIHRDIKPSNILLSNGPLGLVAKLADFGLVRFANVGKSVTATGVLLGTPAYMSPEYISDPEASGPQSDVYSLGVALFEMLTGEVPYRGAVHTMLQRIGRDDPPAPRTLNDRIPRDLETVCLKAMHRDPSRRYATADEFAKDLHRWLGGLPIMARPVTSFELFLNWASRNRRISGLTAIIAGLLVAIASVSTFAAWSLRKAERRLIAEKVIVEATSQELARSAANAELSAADAQRQRQIAIESLNSLVTKVQDELASRPGTIALRKNLLETALAGLERITASADRSANNLAVIDPSSTEQLNINPQDIDTTTIEAHLRKGEILDLLGKTSEALPEFDLARTMAQKLVDATPESLTAQRSLAKALVMQADVHRKAFAYDLALPIYQRALAMFEKIAELSPQDGSFRHALISTRQRIADIHFYNGDYKTAEPAYRQLLEDAKVSSVSFPKDLVIQRDLATAYERLGTHLTTVGSLQDASEYIRQSLVTLTSLLTADPENKSFLGSMAFTTKRLASLESELGNHKLAEEAALNAIDFYATVSRLDPTDTEARMKLGAGWDQLCQVRTIAGELPSAAQAVQSGAEIFEELAADNPTASKYPFLAMEAYDRLYQLQIRLGQHRAALHSVKQTIRLIERCQKASDVQPENLEQYKADTKKSADGIERFLDGDDLLTGRDGESGVVLFSGRMLGMYEAARSGDVTKALALGEKLNATQPSDPMIGLNSQLFMARAYALCVGHLASSNESLDRVEQMNGVLDHCIGFLETILSNHLVAQNPAAKMELRRERDFDTLRQMPDFAKLFDSRN